MTLEILYKHKFTERLTITTAWQDIHMGFDTLYFETPNDELVKDGGLMYPIS